MSKSRDSYGLGGLEELFRHVVQYEGSDLFIQADAPPSFRVDGFVRNLSNEPTSADLAKRLFESILNPHQQEQYVAAGEVDSAFDLPGIGRFRVNVFSHRGRLGYVFRHVRSQLPQLAALRIPVEQITRLASLRRGLVLVTGTAGSGKSTTLA